MGYEVRGPVTGPRALCAGSPFSQDTFQFSQAMNGHWHSQDPGCQESLLCCFSGVGARKETGWPDTQYLRFLPCPVGPVPPSNPSQTLVSMTRSGNIIWGRYKYLQGFHVRKGSEFQGRRIPVEKAPGLLPSALGTARSTSLPG